MKGRITEINDGRENQTTKNKRKIKERRVGFQVLTAASMKMVGCLLGCSAV
jgi:hypothetical protein